MQKWPDNYDVEGVPPGTFVPGGLGSSTPVHNVRGEALELYYGDGNRVICRDRLGNWLPASTYYETSGRRRQVYYVDRAPASSYNPDGTQIHFYDSFGAKLTNDTIDPLYTPPEPEPDPDPDPPAGLALVTPDRLQRFMPDEMITDDLAALAVESASALIAAYTRDRHLERDGTPRPGVAAVALTVAARIAANPGQVSKQDSAGSFSTRRGAGFTGFSLGEQAVLNRYRKRATG